MVAKGSTVMTSVRAAALSSSVSELQRLQLGVQAAEQAVDGLQQAVDGARTLENQVRQRAARNQAQNERWKERCELQRQLNLQLRGRIEEAERRHETVLALLDLQLQKWQLQQERRGVQQLVREEREHRRALEQQCVQEYEALRQLINVRGQLEEKLLRQIHVLDSQLELRNRYATSPRTSLTRLPPVPLTSRPQDAVIGEEQLLTSQISRLDSLLHAFSNSTGFRHPSEAPDPTQAAENVVLKELHNIDQILALHSQTWQELPQKSARDLAPVPKSKLIPKHVDWLTYYQLHKPPPNKAAKVRVFLN